MIRSPISYMARLGGRLIENAYPILPIMPGTKRTGRFTCGEWRDYPGWTRHCRRQTTEVELEIWSQWPDCGIGIACGTVVGVDIDELNGDRAYQLERRARAILGDTPAMRVGLWPKRLLLYRAIEPFGSISEPLEVLCVGRQLVCFADHPGTGRPYQWPDASPADTPLAALPAVDLAAVHTFLGDNRKVANGYHFESSSDLRGTVEAVTDALRFIANADLAYGVWIRMGMAIRGALGEDGGAVFADWSATSSKDVPSTTADAWRRFKPTRIGAGTIYHEARLAGWIPAPTIALNHNGDGAHPAQALLDKLKETRL